MLISLFPMIKPDNREWYPPQGIDRPAVQAGDYY